MGSPSRNVQYHPPRLSEDRLNLPQPPSPSLPTHCSGKSGMRPPRRAVRRIEVPRIPQRLANRGVQPLGQMADDVPPLVDLAALHHAARTEDIGDGPAQPLSAIDNEQQGPVRRQSARHQVAEQTGGDGSRLGGAFAQAQHVFPALCVAPQRDHHAVVPEDLAVDADHPQVQLAQWPAEKPGPTCSHIDASTPRRRPRPACARPAGRWPPPIGSSPGGLRRRRSAPGAAAARPAARPSVTWLSTLPPRHAGRST